MSSTVPLDMYFPYVHLTHLTVQPVMTLPGFLYCCAGVRCMFTESVPEGPLLLTHSQTSDWTDKEQADGYAMCEQLMLE